MALIDQDLEFTDTATFNRDVLPASEYVLAIINSDFRATAKDPANRYVELTFQVLDGPYKGRRLFVKYNVKHTNEKTQNIARRELHNLREAIGMVNVHETQAWHNIRFLGQVVIKAGTDQSNNPRSENKIAKYSKIGTNATAKTTTNAPWGAPVLGTVAPSPFAAPVQQINPMTVGGQQITPMTAQPIVSPNATNYYVQGIHGVNGAGATFTPVVEDVPLGRPQ